MKILVAVDGSRYTKRMLAYLAAHDEWLGKAHDYTVIHAVQEIPGPAAATLDKASLKAYYESEGEKVLKTLRTFFDKQKLRADFVCKVGHPAEVVAAAANKGRYELLLMGSHGRSAAANLLLGSVVSKVLGLTEVPVLVIR